MADSTGADDEEKGLFKEPTKKRLEQLIAMLYVELGRFPTEQEVLKYIFGSDEERKEVLDNG